MFIRDRISFLENETALPLLREVPKAEGSNHQLPCLLLTHYSVLPMEILVSLTPLPIPLLGIHAGLAA